MTALTGPAWDAARRGEALGAMRAELLRRLPHRVPAATRLTDDVRELVVDDAIEFAAIHYQPPVASAEQLTRVFWDAADKRVRRAHEGRYATVRAGYARADLSVLETLKSDETPEDTILAQAEARVVLQFVALLDPAERDVWASQHRLGERDAAGADRVAEELGIALGEVRALTRTIKAKRERFTIIYSAGRLCGYLAPGVAAVAAGDREHRLETGARFHLEIERCPTCRADYTRQLRYLRSARFHGKVGELLPAPAAAAEHRRTGIRDLVADWIARILGHDAPAAAAQLTASGAGRGLGTAAALKLAALCAGSALGACVATGVMPLPTHHDRPPTRASATPQPTATPTEREPALPHGAPKPTPTPTPRPAKTRRKSASHTTTTSTTQGGTGERSHEQTPASPAPANAAPNGASEFDPTFQPNTAPQPAPVPAAPGGSEFQ